MYTTYLGSIGALRVYFSVASYYLGCFSHMYLLAEKVLGFILLCVNDALKLSSIVRCDKLQINKKYYLRFTFYFNKFSSHELN